MDNIHNLFTELLANSIEIDQITENINRLEQADPQDLEDLYRNEFMLYIKHIGTYEDLLLNIEKEPKTLDNEFELAQMKNRATKLLRVAVIEIGNP